MKRFMATRIAILIAVVGFIVPAYGQPGQQDKRRGKREQEARPQQSPQHSREEARAWQQRKGWVPQGGGGQGQKSWPQNRARNWESERRGWSQRGGYGGYYIPQNRFSISFGSGHPFRIGSRPSLYRGFPRFRYGGHSFLLVDPWPEDWADNWYNSDDVYVDYDDGYYLYNRRHPGPGLAITVVL